MQYEKTLLWLVGALWAAVLALSGTLYQHSTAESSRMDRAVADLQGRTVDLEKIAAAATEFRAESMRRLERIEDKVDQTRELVK